jgi:hypothetical protein
MLTKKDFYGLLLIKINVNQNFNYIEWITISRTSEKRDHFKKPLIFRRFSSR